MFCDPNPGIARWDLRYHRVLCSCCGFRHILKPLEVTRDNVPQSKKQYTQNSLSKLFLDLDISKRLSRWKFIVSLKFEPRKLPEFQRSQRLQDCEQHKTICFLPALRNNICIDDDVDDAEESRSHEKWWVWKQTSLILWCVSCVRVERARTHGLLWPCLLVLIFFSFDHTVRMFVSRTQKPVQSVGGLLVPRDVGQLCLSICWTMTKHHVRCSTVALLS